MKLFSRTDQSIFGDWWWTIDRWLLSAVLCLVLCGIMLVASASPPVASRIGVSEYHFVVRHMIFLIPSLFIMLGISLLSPRNIWRLCSMILLGSMAAMVLVLVTGMEIKGAQRWLLLPGFSLQPSEFAKPAFAVVSAWFLALHKQNMSLSGNKIAAALFIGLVSLLLLQPDFGMTVVMSCIFGAQIFLAGLPMWAVLVMGGISLCGLLMVYFTFDHVQSRIDRFLDPDSGDTYQVTKALEAFKEGGLWGTGPGQGTVKLSIPDGHADFIFAIGGEEMGLFFSLFLVFIFAFIVIRGINKVIDSQDLFIILAAGGLLTMFALQSFIHMASSVNIIPTKGMTLPFISYGGSSLLSIALTLGIILSLTRRRSGRSIAKGSTIVKSFSAG